MHALTFLEDQVLAEQDAADSADRLERLADVEAQRRMFLRSEHRAVGIGRRLEETEADGDGKDRNKEHRVRRHVRSREEQAAAGNIEAEAREDGRLIGRLADDDGSRDGDQEVPAVEGALHKGTREVAEREDALELRDQDIVEARGRRPEREETREQDKLENRCLADITVVILDDFLFFHEKFPPESIGM